MSTQTTKNEYKEIPIDEIEPPSRSEKLHPFEGENDDDEEGGWEEFRESVGTEPNVPPTVRKVGDEYELVDGDRRLRALKENDAQKVQCQIRHDLNDRTDILAERIECNEFRKPNDKKARSRYIAQMGAPWLLPPGERDDEVETMTQTEVGKRIGHAQGVISRWLEPMKNEYALRASLADKAGNRPDEDDIQIIDQITNLLKQGGEDGNLVIPIGKEQFVASELAKMGGVSLSEIETVAEKAVEGGWSDQRFLEYLDEKYAYDPEKPEGVDAGMADGSSDPLDGDENSKKKDKFEDNSRVSVDDVDVEDEANPFEAPEVDPEFEELVDDSDLNGESLSELESRKMMSQTIEDDAAVTINLIAAKTGLNPRDVLKEFIEPHIVNVGVAFLREN